MINLNHKHNLNDASIFFSKEAYNFLYKKLEGRNRLYIVNANKKRVYFDCYLSKIKHKIKALASSKINNIWSIYESNLSLIITSKPDYIRRIASIYKNYISTHSLDDEHLKLKIIFQELYNDFIESKGYKISRLLNIKTCPYCNRQYTFTVDSSIQHGVKIRPEFDHFYAKSDYPILAISFYNLIPACSICNHVKGSKEIKIHPYEEGFNCKFTIEDKAKIVVDKSTLLLLKPNQFRITLNSSPNEEENIKVFGLKELYNKHKDYVREIMDKAQAYDSYAREVLIDSFQGAGNTPKQVYDFVWGHYLNDAELENKTLSKLTKDILDQLDIY